jgi:hypothetical protein
MYDDLLFFNGGYVPPKRTNSNLDKVVTINENSGMGFAMNPIVPKRKINPVNTQCASSFIGQGLSYGADLDDFKNLSFMSRATMGTGKNNGKNKPQKARLII